MKNFRLIRLFDCTFFCLCLSVSSISSFAQSDSVDMWVESYMRENQVPGLALGIIEAGRIVKARGYGLANVEHGVPVTESTVFQSASVGKQFTAAAILLLVQDGKLSLIDPISKYLQGVPNEWRNITIYHLLTHTSGIPDYGEDTLMQFQRDYTEEELLKVFVQRPLLCTPGDEWIYSNPGYTILGMIIRALTGEHWGEFIRKRIFEKIGMKSARVISEEDIVPGRAAGYRLVDGNLKNQEWVAPSWNMVAEGSLYLTVLDLAKWDSALYGNSLLSEESKEKMWSPVQLNDGSQTSHGFGWFLINEPRRRVVECDGAWQGFRTYIGRFPEESLTVIVLANTSDIWPIAVGHQIAAIHRPSLAPQIPALIELPANELEEYVGEYRNPNGKVFTVSQVEKGLDIALGPMRLAHLVPVSKDEFFGEGSVESRVVFVRDELGKICWLLPRYHPSWPVRAKKVK